MFDKDKMLRMIRTDKLLQLTWVRKEKRREINNENKDAKLRWFYDTYVSGVTGAESLYNSTTDAMNQVIIDPAQLEEIETEEPSKVINETVAPPSNDNSDKLSLYKVTCEEDDTKEAAVIEPKKRMTVEEPKESKKSQYKVIGGLNIPPGEFTHQQLADLNHQDKVLVYGFLRECLDKNIIRLVRKEKSKSGRGRPTNIYEKI